MTLNGVMALILRYFTEFGNFQSALRKSPRSLSYLLMSFWATVCPLSVCLSVLSVCDVSALWPNGWTNQDETWHAGRPRPWPSSPSPKGAQPPIFGQYLLRPSSPSPFRGGGAGSPPNTMWPGPRPTCTPSFMLIHPTVWPQYTNSLQTDRHDRTDRTTV